MDYEPWPLPASFWEHRALRAIAPEVWSGPLPADGAGFEVLAPRDPWSAVPARAYVYILGGMGQLDILYVGKTVDLPTRMSSHRCSTPWWSPSGHLTLLTVWGEDRPVAEAAALHLEAVAIHHLRPIWNVVGRQDRRIPA